MGHVHNDEFSDDMTDWYQISWFILILQIETIFLVINTENTEKESRVDYILCKKMGTNFSNLLVTKLSFFHSSHAICIPSLASCKVISTCLNLSPYLSFFEVGHILVRDARLSTPSPSNLSIYSVQFL